MLIELKGIHKTYAGYKEGRDIQLDESDVLFTESEQWKGIIHDVYRGTGVTGIWSHFCRFRRYSSTGGYMASQRVGSSLRYLANQAKMVFCHFTRLG